MVTAASKVIQAADTFRMRMGGVRQYSFSMTTERLRIKTGGKADLTRVIRSALAK